MVVAIGTVEAQVEEEISVPEDEEEKYVSIRKSVDQMVQVFGSEKRKRAYSAAQRNMVETGVLETALEPAFSLAQANIEKTPSAAGYSAITDFTVRSVIVFLAWCCRFSITGLWYDATTQPSCRVTSRCVRCK